MKLKDIYIRDPFILPYNNEYYMYGKKSLDDKEFYVYISNDLEEWREEKKVFSPPKDFWGTKEFWAPEVHSYNGKFYLFASFKSETRHRGTQIFEADRPDGDFKPISDEPITPQEWDCLDGTLYIDKAGNPHIVFCHEWMQIGEGTVCEMELSKDLTRAVTKPRILWKASDFKLADNAIKGRKSLVTDGPYLYRQKNGKLDCIWSSFDKDGYMVLMSHSDNGDISGNWITEQKPFIKEFGGHGMIFNGFDGRLLLVMHAPNEHPNERACIYELGESENLYLK